MQRRMLAAAALVTGVILSLSACTTAPSYDGETDPAHDVGIQLFQWNWDSIAKECTDTLGPAGIAWVLTSPPQEHIMGSAWWTAYQPVSYKIDSRLGTRTQFEAMTATCHKAGVKIVVDAVINHMTGQDSGGVGWAGSKFGHYDYPGLYAKKDFHHCGLSDSDDITDYSSAGNVQNCELVNLADLATESDTVQSTIAAYLNDLLSLGADGFRIDAAKHMPAEDIKAILAKVNGDPYIVQEVIRSDGEPITPEQYTGNGDVFEFGLAYQIKTWLTSGQISSMSSVADYGFLPSEDARTFIDNHDTERNRQTLSYRDGAKYLLANILLLSSDYGSPVLYSGYAFTLNDTSLPQDSDGLVTDVSCVPGSSPTTTFEDGDWVCQHHWTGILGMVGWRAAVDGAAIQDEWNEDSAYAFGRGTLGYVAMNASEDPVIHRFETSLPAGDYCDVVASTDCSSVITVAADGSFDATLGAWGAIAIDVNARP